MIKKYNQYIKENNIVYNQDEIDPYGEENWDEIELTPVLKIAKDIGLPYDQITELYCYNENLTNLKGVENLINLETLDSSNNNLTSLEGIENLTNLKRLYCNNNHLTNLNGIENLVNLEYLYCYNNNLTNLEGIENLINLKYLGCSNYNLTSLEGIENLINLRVLYCSNNNFSDDYKQYLTEYCKNKKINLEI